MQERGGGHNDPCKECTFVVKVIITAIQDELEIGLHVMENNHRDRDMVGFDYSFAF